MLKYVSMAEPTLQKRLRVFEYELNSRFVERQDIIHALTLALISKNHVFLLGEPGTAKSALLNTARELIGIEREEYFSYLLTAFSTLDELVGHLSLKALTEEDVQKRQTAFKLPEAKLACIDEIFNASSATLNTLLTMLNERVFHNPEPVPVVLSTLMCSSNRLPDDDSLAAFADRLLVWMLVKDIGTVGGFVNMLTSNNDLVTPVMDWGHIEIAQHEVINVKLPHDVAESIAVLRENLRHHGITPSPRRFMQSIDLVRAEAWLAGRSVIQLSDCRPLRWTMWSKTEDISVVERLVLEMSSDLDKISLELREGLQEVLITLDDAINITKPGEPSRQRVVAETHGKLTKARDEIATLNLRYIAEGDENSPLLAEVRSLETYIRTRVDKDLLDPEQAFMSERLKNPPSF